jgi:hypothetical protein
MRRFLEGTNPDEVKLATRKLSTEKGPDRHTNGC